MVSKIAVVALVAIVATPILLGYGLNFQELTEYRWTSEDPETNVTPLLKEGVAYSYTQANVYSLNTDNFVTNYTNPFQSASRSLPRYVDATSSKTSLPLKSGYFGLAGANDLTLFTYLLVSNPALGLIATIDYYDSGGNSQTYTANNCTYVFYDYQQNSIYVVEYNGGKTTTVISSPYMLYFSGTPMTSPHNPYVAFAYRNDASNDTYINIAGGFRFPWYSLSYNPDYYSPMYSTWMSPSLASDVLITLDLSRHNSSEHHTVIELLTDTNDHSRSLTLENTYSNGEYTWTLNGNEIIYDNTNSDNNCYQLLITRTGAELRYIGSWPTDIGAANVYRTYTVDWTTPLTEDQFIKGFTTGRDYSTAATTLVMRIDAATTLAASYNVISNATYDPSRITGYDNSETTLANVYSAGTSLVFGGNTYVIKNNNITMGSHQIPLSGMKLTSTLNDNNQYENKINGTLVSTTANPSTITFNGQWLGMSVSTKEMQSESYTVNKWIAGEFAWDGLDQNFLLVGLLSSVAAFIGLAMYGRRSGAKVLPLLVVCGGAAIIFFCML